MESVSYLKGIKLWSAERFPLINVFSAFLLFYLVASAIRSHLANTTEMFYWSDLLAGLGLTLQFLFLRVLDEHKDYKRDQVTHPDRVLQKGWITLKTLKIIGAMALLGSLLITLYFSQTSPTVFYIYSLMLIWTGLMTAEFFMGRWLNRHLLLYSISHMLVLPLMILWASAMVQSSSWQLPIVQWLVTLTFTNGLIYEVIRKMKGKDEILQSESSFTKEYGVLHTVVIVILLSFISLMSFVLGIRNYFSDDLLYIVPTVLFYVTVVIYTVKFIGHPERKMRQICEGLSALFVLSLYSTLIFAAYVK